MLDILCCFLFFTARLGLLQAKEGKASISFASFLSLLPSFFLLFCCFFSDFQNHIYLAIKINYAVSFYRRPPLRVFFPPPRFSCSSFLCFLFPTTAPKLAAASPLVFLLSKDLAFRGM